MRQHTRCALVTGVQTCALPICPPLVDPAQTLRLQGARARLPALRDPGHLPLHGQDPGRTGAGDHGHLTHQSWRRSRSHLVALHFPPSTTGAPACSERALRTGRSSPQTTAFPLPPPPPNPPPPHLPPPP